MMDVFLDENCAVCMIIVTFLQHCYIICFTVDLAYISHNFDLCSYKRYKYSDANYSDIIDGVLHCCPNGMALCRI